MNHQMFEGRCLTCKVSVTRVLPDCPGPPENPMLVVADALNLNAGSREELARSHERVGNHRIANFHRGYARGTAQASEIVRLGVDATPEDIEALRLNNEERL